MKRLAQQNIHQFYGVLKRKSVQRLLIFFLSVISGLLFVYGSGLWLYRDRVYPGVKVGELEVGSRKLVDVWVQIDTLQSDYIGGEVLTLEVSGIEASESAKITSSVDFGEIDLKFSTADTATEAFGYGRGGKWWENVMEIYWGWVDGYEVGHYFKFNQAAVELEVEELAEKANLHGARAEVVVSDGEIEIFEGENGLVVDQQALVENVAMRIGQLDSSVVVVDLGEEINIVDENQVASTLFRANRLLGGQLDLEVLVDNAPVARWFLSGADIVGLLDFDGGFDAKRVVEYVSTLSEGVNRPAQDASFKFENGRVVEFAPSYKGVIVDEQRSSQLIVDAMFELEKDLVVEPVTLAVREIAPSLETPDVNSLGIAKLLGRGESEFKGSIAGRVHNVALTASRLHGILIPPGEVFSFNGSVGEVSRATGFQSAYIIKDGRTILGDGGGVCQDSTTMFRAVLDAGLPIVERRGHSYRVGYYEQNREPGFDATVYAPSVDFKFKNDTPAHVLVQAFADTAKATLVIELYGTDDGRSVKIANYQIWDKVPAPPPLYEDDPTLPAGVVKQVDFAAPGAKVKFDYVVTRDGGVVFEKTYYTNYRPWQAVYLRGV